MSNDTSPGVKYEERSGVTSTLREATQNVFGIVGTAKRGPSKFLATSWNEVERISGGLKDDEPGMLHAYGFYAEGGQFLAYSRIKSDDARHSSRYVLDTVGRSLAIGATRWETGDQDTSLSFRKGSSSLSLAFPVAMVSSEVSIATGKFHRAAGSFITDGYAIGQKITSYGFTDPLSNGTFVITLVTASDISVAETIGADEVVGAGKKLECTGVTVGSVTEFEAGDVVVFDRDVVACYSLDTTAIAFTADAGTDVITHAHDYPSFTKVQLTNSGGALPAGLAVLTYYWTIRQSATTSKLAASLALAVAGTAIDITGAGTGTHTITGFQSNNYLEVHSVEPSTGYINVCKRGVSVNAAVPTGTAVFSATKHKLSTTLASVLDTGAASATLTSVNGVKVGTVLLFLPAAVTHTTLPFSRTVTGISGSTVALDSVPAAAYAAGSKVVSVEFDVTVKDGSRVVEKYPFLSASSTHPQYFQDKLGPGISFSYGATPLCTTASDIDGSNITFTLSVTAASVGLAVGDWVRMTLTSAADPSAEGITAQIKTVSGSDITIDKYGLLSSSKAAGLDVYLATPTIADSSTNKSAFIILDNVGVWVDGDQTTSLHLRVPYPYVDLTLTGGQYGSEPATIADIIGDSTPGQKTGIYAFEDMDEYRQIAAFSIPGLLDSDSTSPSRQSLDTSAISWAEAVGTTYVTSVPSTITRPLDAKSYRLSSLALQSSAGALYFGGGKMFDPRDTSRVLEFSAVDGFQLGLMARRAARGVHVPPANVPYRSFFDVMYRVSSLEHQLLNDAGVNVVLKKKGQGVKPMGSRTLLNADGSMRHQLNCRQWLNQFRRTLEDNFEGLLFSPANSLIFDAIRGPVDKYLQSQLSLGVFKFSSAAGSYFVAVGSETTSADDLAGGDVYVHVGVSLAGALERINFLVLGYEGSVTGVREV